MDKETSRLEKEERLETQKRLELGWRERRIHQQLVRWRQEWLEETLLPEVKMEGGTLIDSVCKTTAFSFGVKEKTQEKMGDS